MFVIDKLQDLLDCQCVKLPQYQSVTGLGGIGATGLAVGVLLGIHGTLLALDVGGWISLSTPCFYWIAYFAMLMFFHLMEFIVTSLFQPNSLSKDCMLPFFPLFCPSS